MDAVVEEKHSFVGLINPWQNAFHSNEILGKLISNFYGHAQNAQDTKDAFGDDLLVFAWKTIVHKLFHLEAI